MTQQADWIKEREAIRRRVEAAAPGLWTPPEKQHAANAEMLAHALADLRTLLAKSEEDGRHMEQAAKEAGEFGEKCYVEQSRLQSELALRERRISELKQEAQIHAQEARSANATINEIYQVVRGATGEVGNWHGAEPVRDEILRLRKANEEVWRSDRYYEIICDVGVIGVCSGDRDTLLHAAVEDQVTAFGEISKEDFERYGDDDWADPISTVRWQPVVKREITLTALEAARQSREDEGK